MTPSTIETVTTIAMPPIGMDDTQPHRPADGRMPSPFGDQPVSVDTSGECLSRRRRWKTRSPSRVLRSIGTG